MTERSRNGASSDGSEPKRSVGETERVAEEWAERVGRWIARTAALAKEEAEDVWADAQALRRRL